MANTPLDVDWQEVRSVAETGMPIAEVAKRFEILEGTVRKRAERENWLTNYKVEALAKQFALSKKVKTGPSAAQIVAETWEERRTKHREKVHTLFSKLLDEAVESPPMVENVGDLEKVVKMQRLNLGLDSGETKVQLNIWGGLTGGGGAMREVSSVEIESDPEEWDL